MSQQHKVVKVGARGGIAFDWMGMPYRILAESNQTGGRFGLVECRISKGQEPPPHAHSFEDETYIVLSGEIEFTSGGTVHRVDTGGAIHLPRGAAHGFRVLNEGLAHLLVLFTPGGMEELFLETAALDPHTPEFGEAFTRFGLTVGAGAQAGPAGAPATAASPARTGPVISLVGDTYIIRLGGYQTGGAYSLIEFEVAPHAGPPPHIHHREYECFYIVEGEMTFFAQGKSFTGVAGDFVIAPPGIAHAFRNETEFPARALVIVAPSGLEAFFAEAGYPLAGPDAPGVPFNEEAVNRILAAAPRYGLEMLPPGSTP